MAIFMLVIVVKLKIKLMVVMEDIRMVKYTQIKNWYMV